MLIDSWKHTYSDLFVDSVRRIVDPRDIKYIVVHHMEPDHSGSLPKLLSETGVKPTLVGRPLVKDMLKFFYGIETNFKAVKDLDALNIGSVELRFIHIPWLHRPDTIATYIKDLKVLLTCDAFGGYWIPPTLYDDEDSVVQQYLLYVRKYVATVIGHYSEYILKNIEKVRALN